VLETTTDLKLRNESAILNESMATKLIAGSSANERELANNFKAEVSDVHHNFAKDIVLEKSSYMVDSYSSKLQEITTTNSNGVLLLDGLFVDNIKIPGHKTDKRDEKKSSFGPVEGSCN